MNFYMPNLFEFFFLEPVERGDFSRSVVLLHIHIPSRMKLREAAALLELVYTCSMTTCALAESREDFPTDVH